MIPRILIIDDKYGASVGRANSDRNDFCQTKLLKDITGDCDLDPLPQDKEAIAEAYFYRAQQVHEDNFVTNKELQAIISEIEELHSDYRFALILLDLQFDTGQINKNGLAKGRPADKKDYFGLKILDALSRTDAIKHLAIVVLSDPDNYDRAKHEIASSIVAFMDKGDLTAHSLDHCIFLNGLVDGSYKLDIYKKIAREKRNSKLLEYITDLEGSLIGHSLNFLMCLRQARRAAMTINSSATNRKPPGNNVLIVGDSGTGKEALAKYIHVHSPSRRLKSFIAPPIHATSELLLEDQIFGHDPGAFTGALKKEDGAAKQADGGTLFIDEFGDLPDNSYVRLLRLIDKNIRETKRQGTSAIPEKVDIQFIGATNNREFLERKAYKRNYTRRIDYVIELPGLHERRSDISLLVEAFTRRFEQNYGARRRDLDLALNELTKDKYTWPANIGQLENIIQKAVAEFPTLTVLHPSHLDLSSAIGEPVVLSKPLVFASQKNDAEELQNLLDKLAQFPFPAKKEVIEKFEGLLPNMQSAYVKLIASYLDALLEANKGKAAPTVRAMTTAEEDGTNAQKKLLAALTAIDFASIPALAKNSRLFRTLAKDFPHKSKDAKTSEVHLTGEWNTFYRKIGMTQDEINTKLHEISLKDKKQP